MRKDIRTYLLAGLMCCAMAAVSQQDPQYSLYQFNQLVINPAYAGARDAIAVVADVRKQWTGFDGAPTTAAVSVHSPFRNNKLGAGLNLVSDRLGPKSVTGIYGNFAYIAKLGTKLRLSFGARAGYINYKFNYSEIKYRDQANETAYADLASANRGALDIDMGLYLRNDKFYAGLSITHLNAGRLYNRSFQLTDPTTGFINDYSLSYNLQPHIFLLAGRSFIVNEDFVISPSIMFKMVKGFQSFDLNLNCLVKKRVWLGVFARRDYGAGFLFQVFATDKLKVGYAYDSGLGKDKRRLGGAHEIMIGYDFARGKAKMVSPRFL